MNKKNKKLVVSSRSEDGTGDCCLELDSKRPISYDVKVPKVKLSQFVRNLLSSLKPGGIFPLDIRPNFLSFTQKKIFLKKWHNLS